MSPELPEHAQRNREHWDAWAPEYAKRERSVLNRQGVEVRRLEAERTPEQIAAAEVRDAERRKRRDRDQFLLTTYTSAKDIEALRDQRLQQIGDQRKSMENFIDTLTSRLDALQIRQQVVLRRAHPKRGRPGPEGFVLKNVINRQQGEPAKCDRPEQQKRGQKQAKDTQRRGIAPNK